MDESAESSSSIFSYWNGEINDNDNVLFDHNVQIEITIFNSLENQIINHSSQTWHVYYFSLAIDMKILLNKECEQIWGVTFMS